MGNPRRTSPTPLWIAAPVSLLLCGGAPVPTLARAAETAFQFSNQFELYYDTKLQESLLDDRLDALVSNGPYSLGASFLSHSPSNYAGLDPFAYGPQRQEIRKRWLEAETENWGVRVGHVYGSFGRGLALSIFEDQVVSFDNALNGASGHVTYGRNDVQFLAGTNAFGDPHQVLKAGRVGIGLPLGFHGALEGVLSDYLTVPGQPRPNRDWLPGGSLEGGITSHCDVYGEYVLRDQRVYQAGASTPAQGHAGYGNVNLSAGPVQLLGEYKDILRYDLPKTAKEDGTLQAFVNPPTAVRQQSTTLLNRGSHMGNIRLDDEYGGMVEALIRMGEQTHLAGSYSGSRARKQYAGNRLPTWETFGELEQHFGETAQLILRADETEETLIQGSDPVFFERITYGGALTVPVHQAWSAEVGFETQGIEHTDLLTQAYTYPIEARDNVASITLSRAPNMSWALTGEKTTETETIRNSWLWGEWSIRIAERHQLLIGGGSIRGGQVCSGGVCRIVQPFSGGRIELLTTF